MNLPGSLPAGDDVCAHWGSQSGVAESVARARELVDRVLVHRMVLARGSVVAAESALRGARAAAALAGDSATAEAPQPILAGAMRVYAELARLRSVWRSSPRQALARLHLLAAADLVDRDALGRPVTGEAAAALGSVAALALSRTPAPAIVLAAVVRAELLQAAPFAAGNEVVACAAFRLVLAERGLDPQLLTVPELGFAPVADDASALAAYGLGSPEVWLRHCAEAVRLGATEALAMAESLARG